MESLKRILTGLAFCLLPQVLHSQPEIGQIKDTANPAELRRYDPQNNFAGCRESVRSAIAVARRLTAGGLDFTCHEGSVWKLYFSSPTLALASVEKFIGSNAALFGIEGSSVNFKTDSGGRQYFEGYPIAGMGAVARHLHDIHLRLDYDLLTVRLVKTNGWKVRTTPSPANAKKFDFEYLCPRAKSQWRDSRMIEADGGGTGTEIRADGCGNGKPALVKYCSYKNPEREKLTAYFGVRISDGAECLREARGIQSE